MFCSKCGSQITEGDFFCPNCGNQVRQNSQSVYSETVINESVNNKSVNNDPVYNEPINNEPINNEPINDRLANQQPYDMSQETVNGKLPYTESINPDDIDLSSIYPE
ncbi:MAG TPA: zinc-ribbon domain-containing protein, partial [Lachnospiraceae bacterium]|nr:zinc-ribbon domain-containing protein [Lachnospiraceae bacterium]